MNIPPCDVPPPPLKRACALCSREISSMTVCIAPVPVKDVFETILTYLPGGHILIDKPNFCPVCGREIKEVSK